MQEFPKYCGASGIRTCSGSHSQVVARSLRPAEALTILPSSSRVFFQAVQQWKAGRHSSSPYPGSAMCRVDRQVWSCPIKQWEDLGSEKPGLSRSGRKESLEGKGVGEIKQEVGLSHNCSLWVPWNVSLLQGEQSLVHTSLVCHAVVLLLDHPDSSALFVMALPNQDHT